MPRVLIADDSATMRMALRRFLGAAGLELCGEAASGQQAVDLATSLQPDIITMDVMMPGLDGFQATQAILAKGPARIVIVSAAGEALQADLSFRALRCGALDLVDKPEAPDAPSLHAWGLRLAARLVELCALPLEARIVPASGKLRTRARLSPRKLRAFGIAASTGGPPALADLLKPLGAGLPFPVLIAQHIAPGFMPGLARWLQTQTALTVRLAEGGELPLPGEVWMPRDGADLQWAPGGRLRVLASPGGVCPSGDRLLASLAEQLGADAAAAVLTGMGQDGAEGLVAVKRAGGLTFAQDAASCVVDGMPAAAVALGGAEQRLTPLEIGFCVMELGRLNTGAANTAEA
jgi:two-component system chemotaxis response regulator CheB